MAKASPLASEYTGRLNNELMMMASRKEFGWLHASNKGPLDLNIVLLFTRSCLQYIQNAIAAGILSSLYNNGNFWVNIMRFSVTD